MTDYSELKKRLLYLTKRLGNMVICPLNPDGPEAADALEAQAKEIAEKDARIAELEEALTPLADMDYWIESYHNAHDSIEQCNQLTVAEILAARAALSGNK
jgi:hypothetical protein